MHKHHTILTPNTQPNVNKTTPKSAGFTLIEIIITIVVIVILATVVTVGFSIHQAASRDSQRSANMAIISEALEKYYEKNGEYPSCGDLAAEPRSVTANLLPEIPLASLRAPLAPSGTASSILCGDLPATTTQDALAFIGDGSPTCAATGGSCLTWTLRYREEVTKDVKEVESRHKAAISTSGIPVISLSLQSVTAVRANWTAVANASSYLLHYSTTEDFTSVTPQSVAGTSTVITGLTAGTTYYFRVAAVGATGQGEWSDPASIATMQKPSTPTLTAAMVGAVARGTVSAAACSGATAEYHFRTQSTNTTAAGSWSSWSNWSTQRTADISPTNEGSLYTFQAEARCTNPEGSTDSTTSPEAYIIRPIVAPAVPLMSAAMVGTTARGTVSAISCASGTTAQYRFGTRVRNTNTTAAWSAWSAWTTSPTTDITSTNQGYQYSFDAQVRCHTDRADSAIVDIEPADTVRPIATPAAPTTSITVSGISGLNDVTYTGNWSATACPAGTAAWYSNRWITSFRLGAMASPASRTAEFRWLSANTPDGVDGSNGPTFRYADMSTGAWQASKQTLTATNTDEQGSRNGIEAQTLCKTDFHQSAWSGPGNSPRATAAIASPQDPTAPTGFTRTISSDRKTFTTNWTTPKCNGFTADGAYRHRWTGAGGYTATNFGTWSGLSINYGGSLSMYMSTGGNWPSGPQYQLSLTARCAGDYGQTGWMGAVTSPTLAIP